jgi:dihydrofolate reductase
MVRSVDFRPLIPGELMGKLSVVNFVSLDGVMQSVLFADEDREGGFDQGGWVSAYVDETVAGVMADSTVSAAAMLLGRKTYEAFANIWPTANDDEPAVTAMNRMPKYVVSARIKRPTWAHTVILDANVPQAISRLKNDIEGDIVVFGSGGLIPMLTSHDLVDEYRLLTFPILLGAGKRLFRDGTSPTRLTLVESLVSASGVVINTYVRPRPDHG